MIFFRGLFQERTFGDKLHISVCQVPFRCANQEHQSKFSKTLRDFLTAGQLVMYRHVISCYLVKCLTEYCSVVIFTMPPVAE